MTEKKDISDNKKRYHAIRHHAWAGSVLLAIILASRIFIEISDIKLEHLDTIILILGAVIIVYTLIALFLTYKYRTDLISEESSVQIISSSDELEKEKIKADLEKERLKLEKKKAKAEVKKAKK